MRVILAATEAVTIVLAVVGFFLVLALLTFARIVLRKAPPQYNRFRIGVFIERDDRAPDRDEDAGPPTFPRG